MADSESLISGETMQRAPSAAQEAGLGPVPQGDARYEPIGTLGEGGMGRVVEAVDKQFSRVVAIKELRGGGGDGARLLTEALVTGNLEHPGVPAVYERGLRNDGSPFYVMRRVRGRSLEDVLNDAKDIHGRLALLPALTRAAQTLGFAHEKGVVHRDVKPQNIMVGTHGEVFVVDWGLARAGQFSSSVSSEGGPAASPQLTLAGAVMGTPAYMAPEQARGDAAMVDARTDVFALGAVLFRVLAGRPPYEGASTEQALERARVGDHPDLDAVAAAAPVPLREICKKAMAVQPGQRFATAQHLADALEGFATSAVSKAYEKEAGRGSSAALLFGLGATLLGTLGIARLAPPEFFFGPHLFIGGTFFGLSLWLAWLEARSAGRLKLAPLGYAMAASAGLTGFISIGFSVLVHKPDWTAVAIQAAVGLALDSLAAALALMVWGFVLFRQRRGR